MIRGMLLLFFAAVAAPAQTPPSHEQPGSISGVVRNAVSHAPIDDIRVYVRGAAAVRTNAQGEFVISGVKPGRQWISVIDERRAASGGLSVSVQPGQGVTGVDLPVKLGGRISGKITGDDSQPAAGISVVLLQRRFEFGALVYQPQRTVITNEKGEYRIDPVASDRSFLILARKRLGPPVQADKAAADPESRPRVLVPTFYPGSPDSQGAQALTLSPDETREGVDIRMASAASYCIDGSVSTLGAHTLPRVSIAEQQSLESGWRFAPATAETTPDGRFRACGFHPGVYQLAATSTEGASSQRVYANAEVSITGHDAHDVKLLARPAGVMSGEVSWDPPPRVGGDAQSITVYLSRRFSATDYADEVQSASSIAGKMAIGNKVAVPGPFVLEGIPLEIADYTLEVGSLPRGCYLKEASFAGTPIGGQLRLTRAMTEGKLRLVLGCEGGSLTVQVSDGDGHPVAEANLYLLPAGAASDASLSEKLLRAEVQNGWAAITQPIPPGKYLAIACPLDLDGTVEGFQALWRARSRAKEVEIGSNAVARVTLEVIEVGSI
ncbi:MAG: carboxypeptidase-like regulatory domain-containing protein [Bryobacteraceae bacterium]